MGNAFGTRYTKFIQQGYTNVAFGAHHCFPGEDFLKRHGVLPFMFHQTYRDVLRYNDVKDMIEHIYLKFHCNDPIPNEEKKRRFCALHSTRGFLSKDFLNKYGVSPHLYKGKPLSALLKSIADQYSVELGTLPTSEIKWHRDEFARRNPLRQLNKCEYCPMEKPIQLHHFLDREDYPRYTYHTENVVPLCNLVHHFITYKWLSTELQDEYKKCQNKWFKTEKASVFDKVMKSIHDEVYRPILNQTFTKSYRDR